MPGHREPVVGKRLAVGMLSVLVGVGIHSSFAGVVEKKSCVVARATTNMFRSLVTLTDSDLECWRGISLFGTICVCMYVHLVCVYVVWALHSLQSLGSLTVSAKKMQ